MDISKTAVGELMKAWKDSQQHLKVVVESVISGKHACAVLLDDFSSREISIAGTGFTLNLAIPSDATFRIEPASLGSDFDSTVVIRGNGLAVFLSGCNPK